MVLRAAEVLFKDQVAGRVEETASGGSRFVYAPHRAESIACCLPVAQRAHDWRQGLHPFFVHLCPEGWLREQQARIGHVVEDDDLGLLLRYGRDCIGAVSLRPLADAVPFPPITDATANPGRTVSGIQRKLLVTQAGGKGGFAPAPADGPAGYLAKFNSARIDSLVRNEALSLRWTAALLGRQEVTAFQLAIINRIDEPALVVTRFDRGPHGEKRRLEDFAQILGKPRGHDHAGKYDASYEEVARVIAVHSARPAIDLDRLFRRLIAFALIGNCDAHLKNFSLLETAAGLRLSPVYDVVNTALYDGFDQRFALAFDGRRVAFEEIDPAFLKSFGQRIGLPEKAVDLAFSDLKLAARKAAAILAPPQGEGPDGFIHRFQEIVEGACLRLLNL